MNLLSNPGISTFLSQMWILITAFATVAYAGCAPSNGRVYRIRWGRDNQTYLEKGSNNDEAVKQPWAQHKDQMFRLEKQSSGYWHIVRFDSDDKLVYESQVVKVKSGSSSNANFNLIPTTGTLYRIQLVQNSRYLDMSTTLPTLQQDDIANQEFEFIEVNGKSCIDLLALDGLCLEEGVEYQIVNKGNGKVIEIYREIWQVRHVKMNSSSDIANRKQIFYLDRSDQPSSATYHIRSAYSTGIDIKKAGNNNNQSVNAFNMEFGPDHQLVIQNGVDAKHVTIKWLNTDFFLDGAYSRNILIQKNPDNSDNQQWHFKRVDGGACPLVPNVEYRIRMAFNPSLAFTVDSSDIKLKTIRNSENQKFKLMDLGSGVYNICRSTFNSDSYLYTSGNELKVSSSDEGDRRRFLIEDVGNGLRSIKSVDTGLCMDGRENMEEDGEKVREGSCVGNSSQSWIFERLDGSRCSMNDSVTIAPNKKSSTTAANSICAQFHLVDGRRVKSSVDQHSGVSVEECAKLCLDSHPPCNSISYLKSGKTECRLSSSDPSSTDFEQNSAYIAYKIAP